MQLKTFTGKNLLDNNTGYHIKPKLTMEILNSLALFQMIFISLVFLKQF